MWGKAQESPAKYFEFLYNLRLNKLDKYIMIICNTIFRNGGGV